MIITKTLKDTYTLTPQDYQETNNISTIEDSSDEEEIIENHPFDKIIPNHKELSREEISKDIFKFVNVVNEHNNKPEIIKQNIIEIL